MASQVLSGSSNPSYTNNTGQNVRVVINYLSSVSSISWAGVSVSVSTSSGASPTIGRNLAYINGTGTGDSNNMILPYSSTVRVSDGGPTGTTVPITSNNLASLPTELMLAPGQAFNATSSVYNIVIIPEAG